jgi:YD repeat-containing protein
MRKFGVALAIIALAAVSAFGLAACGGGGVAQGPIYLVAKSTTYYSDGSVLSESSYEYDEHGNLLKQVYSSTSVYDHETDETMVLEYGGYDENGYYDTTTSGSGDTSTWEWTIKDGHAVSSTDDQGNTTEYTYYDDGKLKSAVTLRGSERSTIEYDENGRILSIVTEGGDTSYMSTHEWQIDDDGNVEAYSSASKFGDGDVSTFSYRTQCDENGNIIYVYDADDGDLWEVYEYIKIDNPSTYAWIRSFDQVG